MASVSELPAQPRTPRTLADRGRYPEEAGHEEITREDTSDDDEPEAAEDATFAFTAPTGTQPINIRKTHTPSGSITGSINGDDAGMSISETSSSFGATAMDIDAVGVSIMFWEFMSRLTQSYLAFGFTVVTLSNEPLAIHSSPNNQCCEIQQAKT